MPDEGRDETGAMPASCVASRGARSVAWGALVAAACALACGGTVALFVAKVERIRPQDNVFVLLAALAAATGPVTWWLAALRLGRAIPAPAPGPVLRLAWIGGLGLWVATVFALPAIEGSRIGVAIAAWGGLVACGVWLGRAEPRPVGVVGKALLALSIGVVAGEVALRLASVLAPNPLWALDDAGEDARIAAFAMRPGEVRFGMRCNELGFFDEPFAPRAARARPAVAVIGDSFGASFVPHPFHYTTVAERRLGGVELWNAGWSAMSPHEYRRVLERDILPLDPDAVVVGLFLGNDLLEVRPEGGVDRWLRLLFHRDNLLLYQVPRRLLRLSAGAVEGDARPAGEVEPLEVVLEDKPWLLDPLREPGTFAHDEFLAIETRRARVYSAVDGARFAALVGELRRMRALAGERRFGVVLIPDEAMVEDGLWAEVEARAGMPLRRHALREALVEHCRAEGVACLDLLPVLRAVEPMADGHRHVYLLRDTHWNVRGNEAAGEALAPFVRELLGG